MRALISVSDKTGILDFAQGLHAMGITLVSTGNTARVLRDAGLPVHLVSDLTGFPEILGGRVKTLHPAVHAAILARRADPAHTATLATHGFTPIDLVVVNLYPFAATIARPGTSFAEAVEQIDIGGPAMIRAAAKNHADVLVIVDPADYADVLTALEQQQIDAALRQRLAARAFAHTAAYDARIASYLNPEPLPELLTLSYPRAQALRYGENPHQQGALYGDFASYFAQLHGKELSYINVLDIAAISELVEAFDPQLGTTLAIVKHTNPCGVGTGPTPLAAWEAAFATDREAPFGGVIALNAPVDLPLAQAIDEIFSEIIIAPAFAEEALALLSKKKARRLIQALRPVSAASEMLVHSVPGGVLVQQPDRAPVPELRVVTSRAPSTEEWAALRYGWHVVKHVKSNAIVFAAADRTLGIGAGQMSRVDSTRVAVAKAERAGLSLAGSALASDAFFPFADGVEAAAAAGATAVIQPGGSVRDDEVIAAADRLGLTMVFSGMRHFRH